jgi:hypothetical protein
VLIP